MAILRYTMPICRRDSGRNVRRPLIWLRVTNPSNGLYRNVRALIDTGSDRCIFPAWLAEKLGHNLEAGTKTTITGIYDDSTDAWIHTNNFSFRDTDGNEASYLCWTIFSPRTTEGYGILGINGFLDHFKLEINNSKHSITLEEHRPKSTPKK